MSREIKFRAWDTKANNPQGRGLKGVMLCDEWLKDHPKTLMYLMKVETNETYLMQFTGLKDKNGEEIYEGDILLVKGNAKITKKEYLNQKYNVEWDKTHGNWFMKPHKRMPDNSIFIPHISLYAEVIGNIHQDPQLLK